MPKPPYGQRYLPYIPAEFVAVGYANHLGIKTQTSDPPMMWDGEILHVIADCALEDFFMMIAMWMMAGDEQRATPNFAVGDAEEIALLYIETREVAKRLLDTLLVGTDMGESADPYVEHFRAWLQRGGPL